MHKPVLSDCGFLDFLVAKFVAHGMGPHRTRFFSEGWGDLEAVHSRRDEYYEQVRAGNVSFRLEHGDIEWKRNSDGNGKKVDKNIQIDEGSFQTTLHDMMPIECKKCHFHLVQPTARHQKSTNKQQQQQPMVYVIMLASTGEVGRKPRLSMARKLAMKHGYASVIVSTPYYGRRKPPGQHSFYLNTVSDMWKQYGGVIQESAALAEYFLSNNNKVDPPCKVCFTGFSAGACLSIAAAWTCMLGYRLDGSRIGVAAHASPASAGVFASGCVQHLVDWTALKGEPFEDAETTRARFYEELNLLSVQHAVALRDPTNNHRHLLRSIRCTCAVRDLISPRVYAQVLEQELAPLFHDCLFQWLPGGHVHAYMIRPSFQNHMIHEAVQPLLEGCVDEYAM